jgi:ABC-type uncharacterized transport system substrate-binding protein
MRYLRWIILWTLLCVAGGPAYGATDGARIVVLLSEEGGAYREFADSFVARLRLSAKNAPGVEVLRVEDARFERWRGGGAPHLFVTVGTRAAQALIDEGVSIPTLRTLVARSAHESLNSHAQDSNPGSSVAAIYLEQPWERQLEFARLLLPEARQLGAILGPASQRDAPALANAAEKQNFAPRLRSLAAQDDVGGAFKEVAQHSDAILAVPDPAVLTPNSAKWLLYTAYQRGIPVIGFSKSYVTAGALGAVYSTPEQIARQAAEMVARAAQDSAWNIGPSAYPRYFNVALNRTVARSLRLDVPEDEELLRRLNAPGVPP